VDRLLCIEAFVRVAQTSSFSEAARQLGVTGSVITHRIQQLEDFIGTPLFHRSTRHVGLSEIGRDYYQECAQMVMDFDVLTERLRQARSDPEGRLRLQMLPGFALSHFGGYLAEFTRRYPGIRMDITLNARITNPLEKGFDVVFQLFPPPSESLVSRRLFTVKRLFCAAPDYLERYGTPTTPEGLLQHTVGIYSDYPTRNRWQFRSGGRNVELLLPCQLHSNSAHLLLDFAINGGGIACLSTHVCSQSLLDGRLVPLLPDWSMDYYNFLAVYPTTQRRALKVNALIDFLIEQIGPEPPWDMALRERGLLAW